MKKTNSVNKKKRLYIIYIAAGLVVAAALLVVGGMVVYKKGEDNGRKSAKKEANKEFSLGGREAFRDNMPKSIKLPIRTSVGTVLRMTDDSIEVKERSDREFIFKFDDKTKVTRGVDDLKVNDIKKNDHITVFLKRESDDEYIATRIIVR